MSNTMRKNFLSSLRGLDLSVNDLDNVVKVYDILGRSTAKEYAESLTLINRTNFKVKLKEEEN